ncbi:hypothetical protein JTE90_026863 [Oedothorax gibbosus]|uniref:Uncharacterized protein n=1 Tax=Oedothorax gibbosus TaxID=931172 RepID=A0AAV6TZJ4_9ARAC|nr:hypothetical protein JTE90_026863 [Oedothorax gibbosus]
MDSLHLKCCTKQERTQLQLPNFPPVETHSLQDKGTQVKTTSSESYLVGSLSGQANCLEQNKVPIGFAVPERYVFFEMASPDKEHVVP